MAAWLAFWNAATRRRNEADLHGAVISEIYVPWGKHKLKWRDSIYCVYIEGGELHLITRIRVASLDENPPNEESVRVTPTRSDRVRADYDRVVPRSKARDIEYLHTDGTSRRMDCNPRRFQGRASIRELNAGEDCLEALL
jgi:hypothetical protein